jgi:Fic family protein
LVGIIVFTQGGGVEMIKWFLQCLKNALLETEQSMRKILNKATFWEIHENTPINERQRFILNKLLYDFEGKLKTSKWAKMTKCSADTALRDIKDLIEKGILQQEMEGG